MTYLRRVELLNKSMAASKQRNLFCDELYIFWGVPDFFWGYLKS